MFIIHIYNHYIRMNQLDCFRLFFNETNKNNYSILCGDFNINQKNQEKYSSLIEKLYFKNYNTYNVISTNRTIEEINNLCTYGDNAKEICLTSYKDTFNQELIDYIWILEKNNYNNINNNNNNNYNKQFNIINSKIEPFLVKGKCYTQLSDHYGVSSTIEIPNNFYFKSELNVV